MGMFDRQTKVSREQLQGQKEHAPQEDYTCAGKLQVVKTQMIVGGLQTLFGIGLATYGFQLQAYYPFFLTKGIAFLGISLAFFGLISMIWGVRDSNLISERIQFDQWYNTSNHVLPRLLFIASIIKAISVFSLIVTLYIYMDTVNNYLKANNPPEKVKEHFDRYKVLIFTTTVIGAINILTLFWTSFSAYVFSNTAVAFRFALYFFCIVTVGLCGGVIYTATSTYYLEMIHSLSAITDFWTTRVLIFLSGVYVLVLLAIIFTNFTKQMKLYMSIGTLLLLVSVMFVSFNGQLYRKARDINAFVANNCQNQMQIIHEDDLKTNGCPSKYLPVRDAKHSYPECDQHSQTIIWETDTEKENVSKLKTIQCLNRQCCDISGKIYSDWILLVAILGQMVSLYSFVIVSICCFLSIRYSGNRIMSKQTESIFLIGVLLVIIIWIFIMLFNPYEPIKQKPGIITELKNVDMPFDKYQHYSISDVTKQSECEKKFSEYFFLYFNESFEKNEIFDCQYGCDRTFVRIGITATFYKITVKFIFLFFVLICLFSHSDIQTFQRSGHQIFNDDSIADNQEFLGAEGQLESIKQFFSQSVCLSSYQPQANHNLIVKALKYTKNSPHKPSSFVLRPSNKVKTRVGNKHGR